MMSSLNVDRWPDSSGLPKSPRPPALESILVLGSHDTRVAERGAEVSSPVGPHSSSSPGTGRFDQRDVDPAEAEIFAEVAAAKGVPRERMLLEARSTNTGENGTSSRALLAERGLHPRRGIAVQKPYMERRTLATSSSAGRTRRAGTSPQATSTPTRTRHHREAVIDIMVGDFQRIFVYARGWAAPQEIPPEVLEAYENLVKRATPAGSYDPPRPASVRAQLGEQRFEKRAVVSTVLPN